MSKLQKGDRVSHDKLGEGRVDDISDSDVYGSALVMFKDGEFGSFAAWVALSLLSKVEPQTEFSELATLLALGMYERKVWHGRNMTPTEMDEFNNATAEYLAEQLEDAGYSKSAACSDDQSTDDSKFVRLLNAVKEENEAGEISDDVAARLLLSLVDDGADSDLIAMQNWDAEEPRGKSLGVVDGVEYRICDPKPGEVHESWCDKYEPVEPQAKVPFIAEADVNFLHDQMCTRDCCIPPEPQPEKTLRERFEEHCTQTGQRMMYGSAALSIVEEQFDFVLTKLQEEYPNLEGEMFELYNCLIIDIGKGLFGDNQ